MNRGLNFIGWMLTDLAQDYFQGAFGEDGAPVLDYMATLSDLFGPEYFYAKWRTKAASAPKATACRRLRVDRPASPGSRG
jgi:hypothetical protein